MLGVGERDEEIRDTMRDLLQTGIYELTPDELPRCMCIQSAIRETMLRCP